MSTYVNFVHRATGPERVLKVLLDVGSDFAASATNYWTFSLRRFATGSVYGETIASYGLDVRSLTAFTPVVVYDDPRGFDLDDGDRLVLYAVSTGSPAVPTTPVFQTLVQGR